MRGKTKSKMKNKTEGPERLPEKSPRRKISADVAWGKGPKKELSAAIKGNFAVSKGSGKLN